MSIINIQNLTFAYDGSRDNIFENVSFSIDTDWKLGFTGRNGRGKTTFLKLLLGDMEFNGKISSSANFEYFPYEVKNKNLTASEITEQISPDIEYWKTVRELRLLELEEEILWRPFSTLSNGEQTKLLLAAMFLKENGFLLIDEPTNHLDEKGRDTVSKYLNSKKGFIVVSHDRAFLDSCTDHTLSINKTDIEIQKGNFSSWLENKEKSDNFEAEQNAKLLKDIKRLETAAKQTQNWADKAESAKLKKNRKKGKHENDYKEYLGEKSRKMQQRRKNIEKRKENAVEEKSSLLKNTEAVEDLKIPYYPYRADRLAVLKDVSIYYGERTICKDVSFSIEKGDRILLKGINGSGKSSILKLIRGENIPHIGLAETGSGLKISYVSQDASNLCGNLSDYAADNGIDESLFKTILRKFGFSRIQFEKDISDFSGGQKKKVLLAKSLCEEANLYVWDEPMNYIDVISRIQIEELLLKSKPTILFVEHDKMFAEKIATKIITLDR